MRHIGSRSDLTSQCELERHSGSGVAIGEIWLVLAALVVESQVCNDTDQGGAIIVVMHRGKTRGMRQGVVVQNFAYD